ncbi:MAG: PAS domain S-box protein [Chloroflexi bacterium]|nr:PAS domain S-box protein [Chloroflexota bacterium]
MKIRTQFIISTVVFGVIFVIASLSALYANLRVQETHKQELLAGEIESQAFELGYLANDYLLYRESQQASRWESKFNAFSNTLARLNVETPEQQVLANNIKTNRQRLKAVFDEVRAAVEAAPVPSAALSADAMQVSWSRMEVQNQGMIFDAGRLTWMLREQEDQLRQLTEMLNLGLILVFGLLLLTNYTLTFRRILRGMADLHAGTQVIGSGDLDHAIPVKRTDEIGELSLAFNRMTANLKTVTASKTELEREIAERKKAEQALRESEEKYRTIVETATEGIWTAQPDGKTLFVNQRMADMLGYSREELQSRVGAEFLHEDQKREVPQTRAELEKGAKISKELRFRRKDGAELWTLVSVSPLHDGQGRHIANLSMHADITERKRAEERLAYQAHLLANINDAIIATDPERRITSWNPAAERMYGWTQDQVLGKPASEVVRSEFTDEQRAEALKAMQQGIAHPLQLLTYHKDGHPIWNESTNVAVRDDSGKVTGYVSVARDITERKRAAEQIEWLARFPAENPAPVLRLSSDGTILYANPASASVLAYWDCAVGSYAPAYWREVIAAAHACQQPQTMDVDVQDRCYLFFVAPVASAGYVNLYARDITDRKHAEEHIRKLNQDLQTKAAELKVANVNLEQQTEELQVANEELQVANDELVLAKRNLEQQAAELEQVNIRLEESLAEEKVARDEAQTGRDILESLMLHAPEVLIVASAPEVNIRTVSRYAEQMTGRGLAEFLGVPGPTHPFRQNLFLPDHGTPVPFGNVPLVRAIRHGEVALNHEMVLRRPDGSELNILSSAGPIRDPDGKITGAIATWRDITERKRAEEHVQMLNRDLERRAIELEIANKELESFSYSVSHDLRTPLASIHGFANIVLDEYASDLPSDGRQFVELIRNNSKEMNQLVEGLLSFSRFIRQPLRKQTVDLIQLTQQALGDLAAQQQDRRVEIVIGDLPPCRADPLLLKQVLVNLLSNALKFTRQREVARIEISSHVSEEGELVYFVRDNGVGFDSEQAEKLFGVFQRLHAQEDYEGTGVGLAIVERIIRRHGGRVCADAQVDCGATFYFTVPD